MQGKNRNQEQQMRAISKKKKKKYNDAIISSLKWSVIIKSTRRSENFIIPIPRVDITIFKSSAPRGKGLVWKRT
jgi:hypothetical protein